MPLGSLWPPSSGMSAASGRLSATATAATARLAVDMGQRLWLVGCDVADGDDGLRTVGPAKLPAADQVVRIGHLCRDVAGIRAGGLPGSRASVGVHVLAGRQRQHGGN